MLVVVLLVLFLVWGEESPPPCSLVKVVKVAGGSERWNGE